MRGTDGTPSRTRVDDLVAALAMGVGGSERAACRVRLRALGTAAAPRLAGHLAHADSLVRWEVVNLLGEFAHPRTLRRVVRFALEESEVHARWRAYWAVSRFDRGRTVPLLVDALAHRDPRRQWAGALMLSMLQRREAVPVLLHGLESRDRWTRWEALSALKALRPAGIEKVLDRFLDGDQPRDLRQEAVLALGAIGSPQAVEHLTRALRDPEPQVRWRAALALARAGAPAVIPLLRRALRDERDGAVRGELTRQISHLEKRHGEGTPGQPLDPTGPRDQRG
jgi:HEAT repeat protein